VAELPKNQNAHVMVCDLSLYFGHFLGLQGFKGLELQGSILASGLYSGYVLKKRFSFGRPNLNVGAKLAIILEN
jgi:hypothetical protein